MTDEPVRMLTEAAHRADGALGLALHRGDRDDTWRQLANDAINDLREAISAVDGARKTDAERADYYRTALLRVRQALHELPEKLVDAADRDENLAIGYAAGAVSGLVAGIDDLDRQAPPARQT